MLTPSSLCVTYDNNILRREILRGFHIHCLLAYCFCSVYIRYKRAYSKYLQRIHRATVISQALWEWYSTFNTSKTQLLPMSDCVCLSTYELSWNQIFSLFVFNLSLFLYFLCYFPITLSLSLTLSVYLSLSLFCIFLYISLSYSVYCSVYLPSPYLSLPLPYSLPICIFLDLALAFCASHQRIFYLEKSSLRALWSAPSLIWGPQRIDQDSICLAPERRVDGPLV